MPVKGVLVTLEDDPVRADAAIATLRGKAGFELGERNEKWLPLVVESPSERESKEAYRWIEALDGVYFVDTVFSSVEGPAEDPSNLSDKTQKREN